MQVQMRIPLRLKDIRSPFRPMYIASDGAVYWYKSGRVALFFILDAFARSRLGTEVVLPAYHCGSMVEACEWAGLTPLFYEVNRDLTPNIDSVREKVSPQSVAVVGVHYFGFPNQLDEVASMCKEAGVPLIEDAAHIDVINGASPGRVGIAGEWTIGSPRKFYPIYDGGCLVSKGRAAAIGPRRAKSGLGDEARSLLCAAESFSIHASGNRDGMTASASEQPGGESPDTGAKIALDGDSTYLDRRFTRTTLEGMTGLSKLLLRALDGHSMWRKRRENYRRLYKVSLALGRCNPLFSGLPDDVVPYVFPLVLNHPRDDHRKLRDSGIDIWRWEDVVPSGCKVSRKMLSRLVQVPCHQGLSDAQLNHVEDAFLAILR